MLKFLYFIEFVVICVCLIPFFLGYKGVGAITLPTFGEVKQSVSVKQNNPAENNTTDFFRDDPSIFCNETQSQPVGLPFAYKTSNGCTRGTVSDVSLWSDYAAAGLIALIVTQLTSVTINRLTRKPQEYT